MAETEAGSAAELVALLRHITEDGTITVAGVGELKVWLEANQHSDLPAIEFLRTTLDQTPAEEYNTLYKAVERVLPSELRAKAKARRVEAELAEKTKERERKAALRNCLSEERKRNTRIYSANFMVAGTSYEGRSGLIQTELEPGQAVYLARDPHNRYDKNAIEIRLDSGRRIGFVPRAEARRMARHLDRGCKQWAVCAKILDSGERLIPVVEVALYRSDATTPDAIDRNQVPQRASRPVGCARAMAVGLLAVLLAAYYLSLR
jgi:hypothetical protein